MNAALAAALTSVLTLPAAAAPLDGALFARTLGRGVLQSGDRLKVMTPRRDFVASLDGFALTPLMGATSWLAFAPDGDDARMQGEIVLRKEEVPAAIKAALKAGLAAGQPVRHFPRETPPIFFLRVAGSGKPAKLAAAARKFLDALPAPGAPAPEAPAKFALDAGRIDAILGHSGQTAGDVHKVVIARPDVDVRFGGARVGESMGFASWFAFSGAPGKAAAAGRFALLDAEVPGLVKALTARGLQASAGHDVMPDAVPRVTFVHFWGVGGAESLARALRAALDELPAGAKRS